MKKILLLFLLTMSVFSNNIYYDSFYDEWDDIKYEGVCMEGIPYTKKNRNSDKVEICIISDSSELQIVFKLKSLIPFSKIEYKFDNGMKLYIGDDKEKHEAVRIKNTITYDIITNMISKKFMYLEILNNVYKVDLNGFTKNFNKIKNSKSLLHNTGLYGLSEDLEYWSEDEQKMYYLLESFYADIYSMYELEYKIEIYRGLLIYVGLVEEMGYDISFYNKEHVGRIAANFVPERDYQLFLDYYSEVLNYEEF